MIEDKSKEFAVMVSKVQAIIVERDALAAELVDRTTANVQLAAIGQRQFDRIRELTESLMVKSAKIGDLEAALREIRDGFLPDGSYAGRPIYEIAPFTAETPVKCKECVYDIREPNICERCGTPRTSDRASKP